MFTITEILDGNIYRVVADSELAKNTQTSSESDASEVTFDEVFNSIEAEQAVEETAQPVTQAAQSVEETAGSDDSETDLDSIFAQASALTGVDEDLLKAVAQAESGFDTNAVSSGGAMGIMQLMPSTCDSYGVTDPFDAEQNITAGAQVLSWMLDRYDGDVTLALAAYNAGYGNVDKYGGVPPFSQTYAFIDKVLGLL